MLKIAICDDDKNDRERVLRFVNDYITERGIKAKVFVYDHPDTLIKECEALRPHIYILDIVMPMVTGIEAARELRWNQMDAQIIFATSESSFALESFDVNPINYIVKPVEKAKLFETLDLAIRRVDISNEKTITVKIKGGNKTIDVEDIMYLDYRNHVVMYHLYDKSEVSTPTLRIGFTEYLTLNHNNTDFVRCHESISVRVGAIDVLSKSEITLRNLEIIPVARARYTEVSRAYMESHLN